MNWVQFQSDRMRHGEVKAMTVKELYEYAKKNDKLDSDLKVSVMFDDIFYNFSETERITIFEKNIDDRTVHICVDRTGK